MEVAEVVQAQLVERNEVWWKDFGSSSNQLLTGTPADALP